MWDRFIRDLGSSRKGWLVVAGASLLWQLAMALFASETRAGMMALLAWAPLIVVPFWSMWTAGAMLHARVMQEAPAVTPASGFRLVLLQLLAATVQSLVLIAVIGAGALLVFRLILGVPDLLDMLPIPDVGWMVDFLGKGLAMSLVLIPALAAATQVAYLFARMVEGYRAAMGAWIFVMLSWAALRIVPPLTGLFRWLPDIAFRELYSVAPAWEFRSVLVDPGPIAAFLVFTLGLAAAAGPLLHHIESTRGMSLAEFEAARLRRA